MPRDNGSATDIVTKAIRKAEMESFPDTMKIVTGNLFPNRDSLTAMQEINNALTNRLKDYVVVSENDITPSPGFITVILTKK